MSKIKDLLIKVEDLEDHVQLMQDLLASANRANERLSADNARLSIAIRELEIWKNGIEQIDSVTTMVYNELEYLQQYPEED